MNLAQIILALQPKAEFVLTNNDYDSIRWDNPAIPKPTKEEIDTYIKNYKKPLSLEERVAKLEATILGK